MKPPNEVPVFSAAASYTILPLLTLQMTSLGLTLADVAQVYLFMPIASLLAPLVIGEMHLHGYWIDSGGHFNE